jgi:hypothetical protein
MMQGVMVVAVMIFIHAHYCLGATHPLLGHLCCPKIIVVEVKLAHLPLKLFHIQTSINEGAQDHIPAGPCRTVKIGNLHGLLRIEKSINQ